MARLKFEEFPKDIKGIFRLANSLRNDKPLRRLLFLAKDLGCKTIVYQNKIKHSGFQAEWDDYYKYMRPMITNKVDKLHFFKTRIVNSSELQNTKSSDYLGYITLRPLPIQRVVEAILRPPKNHNGNYILAKGKFTSVVAGRSFEIEGTPFVQQDGNVGVCAHASLATISQIIPQIFSSAKYEPWTVGEIKRCVNAISSPAMGPGLQLAQVARVFSEMGYSGDTVYRFPEDQTILFTPEQIIYIYAESKIPVFVGLPLEQRGSGHSVVVIGHAFDKQAWWPEALPSYYVKNPLSAESWISSVCWANEWVICDDNFGSYLAMPKHLCNVSWVAVPLPQNILLKGETATLNSFWAIRTPIFKDLTEAAVARNCSTWIEPYQRHLAEGKLVLRVFLTSSEEFRDAVRIDTKMNQNLARYYQSCDLPEYFWITELSIPELFREGYRLGEVLINPYYPAKFVKTGH